MEDWITHMEKLFQVLGCPDKLQDSSCCVFKLEGDALSWWKAHLLTQVGGDALPKILYLGCFSWIVRNSGEYMERSLDRLRLPPVTLSYCMRVEIRSKQDMMVSD
ncbi:hypothetical protein Tco_0709813 [Tanacetum coccineum]